MPVWALAASILLFTTLAFVASGHNIVPADEAILDLFQDVPNQPGLFLADLGNIFGATAITPIVLIGLAVLAAKRQSTQAVVFCLISGIMRFTGMFLKWLIDSPRPTTEFGTIRADFEGLGFPSGHAFTSALVAGATTIVLLHLLPNDRSMKLGLALLWLWTALCCYARIWYGAHWPSDILGGLLAATAVLGLSTNLSQWATRRSRTTF